MTALLVGFIAFLIAALSGLPATAQETRPSDAMPNVIIVLVDDLGWTDLGCYGSEYYETPNIDRLARRGLRFTNGYAACAVCSPTRAAVLTGRYPARTGVTDWIRAKFQGGTDDPQQAPTEYVGGPRRQLLCPPNPFWLEHNEVTLAEILHDAGYRTCHIGKWHLGGEPWSPITQGFELNIGGCDYGQPPTYFDPYFRQRQGLIPTLPPRKTGEFLTDREGDEAVNFITAYKDQPFFLYLAHYAVHTPIQGKPDVVARYQQKPKTNQKNATYAALVESVDDSVGKVMATLEELELTDNTLVIFTSDNGGLIGPTDNAPLRSGKGFPYEGGIRVPFIVHMPGAVKAGESDVPVCSVDLLPTVAAAAGIQLEQALGKLAGGTPPKIDGIDLTPTFSGDENVVNRNAPLFWHFPHYRTAQSGPYSIVRDGDWKLIKWYEGPRLELFNLKDDLSEERDVAESHPDRVRELSVLLDAHLRETNAKLPAPNPNYTPQEDAAR